MIGADAYNRPAPPLNDRRRRGLAGIEVPAWLFSLALHGVVGGALLTAQIKPELLDVFRTRPQTIEIVYEDMMIPRLVASLTPAAQPQTPEVRIPEARTSGPRTPESRQVEPVAQSSRDSVATAAQETERTPEIRPREKTASDELLEALPLGGGEGESEGGIPENPGSGRSGTSAAQGGSSGQSGAEASGARPGQGNTAGLAKAGDGAESNGSRGQSDMGGANPATGQAVAQSGRDSAANTAGLGGSGSLGSGGGGADQARPGPTNIPSDRPDAKLSDSSGATTGENRQSQSTAPASAAGQQTASSDKSGAAPAQSARDGAGQAAETASQSAAEAGGEEFRPEQIGGGGDDAAAQQRQAAGRAGDRQNARGGGPADTRIAANGTAGQRQAPASRSPSPIGAAPGLPAGAAGQFGNGGGGTAQKSVPGRIDRESEKPDTKASTTAGVGAGDAQRSQSPIEGKGIPIPGFPSPNDKGAPTGGPPGPVIASAAPRGTGRENTGQLPAGPMLGFGTDRNADWSIIRRTSVSSDRHPEFPDEAQVTIRLDVGMDGVPRNMRVVRSSGSKAFEDAWIEKIAEWRFMVRKPVTLEQGFVRPYRGDIPIENLTFDLTEQLNKR